MARVICDMSASLDGYVTGPNDSRENPFGDGDAARLDLRRGDRRSTGEDADHVSARLLFVWREWVVSVEREYTHAMGRTDSHQWGEKMAAGGETRWP
jgi:hypothetical protein